MRNSRIELLRKRNLDLSAELDELRFELEYEKKLKSGSMKKAKDLIDELESIKIRWNKSLDEIEQYKMQYEQLISELRHIKSTMFDLTKAPKYKKKLIDIKKIIIPKIKR